MATAGDLRAWQGQSQGRPRGGLLQRFYCDLRDLHRGSLATHSRHRERPAVIEAVTLRTAHARREHGVPLPQIGKLVDR